jgi:ABC-type antimicrobial peptide transport system permease subunit
MREKFMQSRDLIKSNLRYFWRTNLAVVAGVATAVAVLAGALLVGDSVRASLRNLALSRLGRTDVVLTAQGFFRQQLATDLQSHPEFAANFNDACSMIALRGAITRDANNARAGSVQVYGIDDRFWKFHGVLVPPLEGNDALLSPALAAELGAKPGDTLVLRIEKPSDIPAESLHGRKDDLGKTLRFTLRESLPASSLGEFFLQAQQGPVFAIFAPLSRLQKNLEQDARVNVVLFSAAEGTTEPQVVGEKILREKFALADLGLRLRALKEEGAASFALESDSAVINDAIANQAKEAAAKSNLSANPILAYLANSIRLGEKEVPYSLVGGISFGAAPAAKDAIRLTDWAARDLGAKVGDEIRMGYYVWRPEGRLETKETAFKVESIVPLKEDRHFAPEYPGITEARSLADWDPPFPLDLGRVRKVDEAFWDQYRATPKAFLPIETAQELWGTRYGRLTSIRFSGPADAQEKFSRDLRAHLDPITAGLQLQSVRSNAMRASRGATDFGEYFAYFSFFLVISALMLATLFFKLGIEQRLREIGLLRALGFSIKQLRSLFLREGLALAAVGGGLGAVGGLGYAALMMWGLRTWWIGAVGTTALRLYLNPVSLIIGIVAGVVMALVSIWWTLRGLRSSAPRSLLAGVMESAASVRSRAGRLFSAARLGALFALLGILLLVAGAMKWIGEAGGFFGAGAMLLIAILCFWSVWLRGDKRRTIAPGGLWPLARMGFRNASVRPGRSVLCIALIASAAFIIVSVDAFRRDGKAANYDKASGNGGYPLMAESLLPIVHDLNSEPGREEVNLNDPALSDVKFARFRLRPGDDASCLNLYQPRNPRILGATDDFIAAGRFAFQSSLAAADAEKANPWLLLNQEIADATNPQSAIGNPQSIIPVIGDANSMMYVLHLNLGDEITVDGSDGAPVRLRLVATLADSVFQGELLMAEKQFLRHFADQEGYRVFLVDAPPDRAAAISATLEDRLSDFGFDATGAEERLAAFHQVENTYLSTFQTLGGLGLLLGTLGLAAVLLRNVLERRKELALMRSIGYRPPHLSTMIVAENALLLGCGLLTGIFCAFLAILPAILARGGGVSIVSLGLLLLAVAGTGLSASLLAVRAVNRSPVLPALRSE